MGQGDGRYDVIVIGAGHNGLILGNYLARAGLSTVVFDTRLEAGGGLSTEEISLPGFWHNLHSYFHDTIEIMPPFQDLKLEEFNAHYIRPPVQFSIMTRDHRAAIVHDDIEATCRSLARFSERDARTWREVQENYREFMESLVVPALYSPPPLPGQQMEALQGSPEGLEYLRMSRMSAEDVVKEMFESPEVQALVLHQCAIPRGILPDYNGLGFVVPLIASQVERSQICAGGSHILAHALFRALYRAGGRSKSGVHVTKILMEGNRAVGVEVLDGSRYYANKAVVSAIDLKSTFLNLVGPDHLAADLVRKVENFKLDEFSVFSVHLALTEPPQFRAAAFDPDIDNCLKFGIGYESPADFTALFADIRLGRLPQEVRLYGSVPTLFDVNQAPPGKHTAFLWQLVPYEVKGEDWSKLKEDYKRHILAAFQEYAPNITKDKILAAVAITPPEIPAKIPSMVRGGVFMGRTLLDQIEYFRPLPELSQYRTPVDGLYLCGAACHPGGGIIGAAGYIAAGIVADDLGVPRWWE